MKFYFCIIGENAKPEIRSGDRPEEADFYLCDFSGHEFEVDKLGLTEVDSGAYAFVSENKKEVKAFLTGYYLFKRLLTSLLKLV